MANPNPSPETRFQPGRSGNPTGKPKSKPVTDRLRELLAQQVGRPLADDGSTNADVIAAQILKAAMKGDHKGISLLLDRIEGKVPDHVITEQADGVPTLRKALHDPEPAPDPDST